MVLIKFCVKQQPSQTNNSLVRRTTIFVKERTTALLEEKQFYILDEQQILKNKSKVKMNNSQSDKQHGLSEQHMLYMYCIYWLRRTTAWPHVKQTRNHSFLSLTIKYANS
jgi:hypothetical protein